MTDVLFSKLAPLCRANGWMAVIPLIERDKRPDMNGWPSCALTPLTDEQLAQHYVKNPRAGMGFATGGAEQIIAIDLDFLDEDAADKALALTIKHLGETPFIRIGKYPKRLLLYRYSEAHAVAGKFFGSFEVFSKVGVQVAFFGIHPATGQPYTWPAESPATLPPTAAPEVTHAAIRALIDDLRPLAPERQPRTHTGQGQGQGQKKVVQPWSSGQGSSDQTSGAVAAVMPELRAAHDPLEAAVEIIAESSEGNRYPTMFGCCVSLVALGVSDHAIRRAILPVYKERFSDMEWSRSRMEAMDTAIEWARKKFGDDAASLHSTPWAQSLADEFAAATA
jgi:Bifunctional DNA primase/polymerase, N-terminal